MTNSKNLIVRIPPEIDEAVKAFCQENGEIVSQLVLKAICEHIGRDDLKAAIRPPNRPRKPKS